MADGLVCVGGPGDTPALEAGMEVEVEAARDFPKAARGIPPSALPAKEENGAVTVGCAGGEGPVYEGGCCAIDDRAKLLLSTEEWEGAVGAVDKEGKSLDGRFAGVPPFVSGVMLMV